MDKLPLYIPILFFACTVYTIVILYLAIKKAELVLYGSLMWCVIQYFIVSSEFYENTTSIPPRFTLAVAPSIMIIISIFYSQWGKYFLMSINYYYLNFIHLVRIPVEFGLYGLAIYKAIPMTMTFEGLNFDIVAGLTVPFILIFYYYKKRMNKKYVIIWHSISMLLLLGIIFNAIFAFESPIQLHAFDQPNKGMLKYPYILLPSYIVPVVMFTHIASIRKLLKM